MTGHGPMSEIIEILLNLTRNEFCDIVQIYHGDCLKKDRTFLYQLYDYIQDTFTWPLNLYIKLKDLYLLLWNQRQSLDKLDRIMGQDRCNNSENTVGECDIFNLQLIFKYISPKLLHWADLLENTNFEKCVELDFYECNGKELDLNNQKLLYHCVVYYYNCCWKRNEWFSQIPEINAKFISTFKEGIDLKNFTLLTIDYLWFSVQNCN